MAGLAELLHTSKHSDLFAAKFAAPQPAVPAAVAPVSAEPEDTSAPEEDRTVFIGNVPLDVSKREISAEFEKYGKVEKVWKRSVPVDRGKLSIAVACIRKQYRDDGVACNFYVLFTEKTAAEKALAANGTLFRGRHLRVDSAGERQNHDPALSVFVGNLPFSVMEDELWEEFAEFGTISYVRVVRDRQTHTGKGFAYVCFGSKQSARMALSKHMAVFQGRPMRVFTCKKQVEMNVQRRIKGRDESGAKQRWKNRKPVEIPPPSESPYEEDESSVPLPAELKPRRKRKRDSGPEPAWKAMKREQKKMKSHQSALKTSSKSAKPRRNTQ